MWFWGKLFTWLLTIDILSSGSKTSIKRGTRKPFTTKQTIRSVDKYKKPEKRVGHKKHIKGKKLKR
jgi:hypothetical protein